MHTGMPLHVVVTGANAGLGLELCRQLTARGDAVYAACRTSSPDLDAVGVAKVITGVDVTSDAGADVLVAALQGITVDALVNNGGDREGGRGDDGGERGRRTGDDTIR